MGNQEIGLQVSAEALKRFCERVFIKMGVSERDARVATSVLVEADLRGVDSHGVARLRSFYVHGLRDGMIIARPQVRVVAETPVVAVLDAGGGLGHPIAYRAMEMAIRKAGGSGAGFVAVRNSNHFGIAGYYAMLALESDCIGIVMTNAGPLIAPTFGRDAMLGTNPIAVAAPAGRERPFVLDMATSTVPMGKLEVYERLEKPLPLGWAIDEAGMPTTDTARAIENIDQQVGGGLLPLGGAGELLGGHKGYGLALWVEIFSAILSGAAYADLTYPRTSDGQPCSSQIGHFFGAWRVDGFRPVDEFKAAMDDLQQCLKNAPKAEGQTRIYIHGEKEFEERERRIREGIPLNPKVMADLQTLADELTVAFDLG